MIDEKLLSPSKFFTSEVGRHMVGIKRTNLIAIDIIV